MCGGGWSAGVELLVVWSLVSGLCLTFLCLLLGAYVLSFVCLFVREGTPFVVSGLLFLLFVIITVVSKLVS